MTRKNTYLTMISMIIITLILFILSYYFGWNPGSRVNKITGNGEPMFSRLIYGTFEKPLDKPMDVVVFNKKTYISDTNNKQIQVFDESGEPLFQFGTQGTSKGKFNFPYGISVDKKLSEIYVADLYNGNISIFDENGKFKRYFEFKSKDIKLKGPGGLRIVNDKLYLTDIEQCVVYVISLSGDVLLTITGEMGGKLITAPNAMLPIGDFIYISDSGNDRILKLDSKGKYISTINGSPGGKGPSMFISPRGLAENKDGNVLITDKMSNIIRCYNEKDKEEFVMGAHGSDNESFIFPNSIFRDADGSIYIVDTGNNRVSVFN